jgi:beta-mannosidase
MKRETISRRDCLTLLGSGAGAAFGLLAIQDRAVGAPFTGSEPQAQQSSVSAILSNQEILKELAAARVYAATPVQARPEFDPKINGSNRAGWQVTLNEGWELAQADDRLTPGQYSLDTSWLTVPMPRPVCYALMEAGQVPNLWYGENFRTLQWIQQRDWYLRYRVAVPDSWRDHVVRLRFDGLDYFGMAWLDGEPLGAHEGSFGGPTFDISDKIIPGKTQELLVRLVHETHDLMVNFDNNASENHKPRVAKPDAEDAESYQWGNRYRTMGLYQPIRLVITGQAYLESPFVRTDSVRAHEANLWAQAMLTNTGASFECAVDARIVDLSNQKVVWQATSTQKVPPGYSFWEREITLRDAKLWWPNGLGDQPLYRLELMLLKDGAQQDVVTSRFGIRTLELRRNPIRPDSPRPTPIDKTTEDEAYRYLWVANGRPFYGKGGCWMASDDVLALTPEREEWMIRAAKFNGMNLLRLNGGTSLIETEQFYNLCDEHGIIVWQDVPLNWADNPGTTNLAVWREQITQSVLRIRQHPSIGVYVGGNEYDPYSDGMEPLLGLIREILAGYDGTRPYRMNSPNGGDYHAYDPEAMYTGDVNWYHKLYDRGHDFISEWSFSSFSNMSLLKRIVPPEEMRQSPVGYDIEAFKRRYRTIRDRSAELGFTFAKNWQRASWYGDLGKADLEHLVDYSQMAYDHTLGYVLEQWRAQFPYTGGEALWTYNSLGPVAASWHIIDWCGQPQIPYYAAKRANEPVHIMADTGFFSWGPGDAFHASVFALNDQAQILKNAGFSARVYDQEMKPVHEDKWTAEVPADGYASEAHEIRWPIPSTMPEGYFFLELSLTDGDGKRVSRRAYWLRVLKMLADPAARKQWQVAPVAEPLTETGPWLRPQVEPLSTSLKGTAQIERRSKSEAELTLVIENSGTLPAYPVSVQLLPDAYSAIWSDNYFWLAPGEKVSIQGIARLDMTGLDPFSKTPIAKDADLSIRLSAWNAAARDLQLRSADS